MVDDRIMLRGVGPEGPGDQPTILQRTDQEFVEAVLDELALGDGLKTIGASVVSGGPRGRFAGVAREAEYSLHEAGIKSGRVETSSGKERVEILGGRESAKVSREREVTRRVNRKGNAEPVLQLFQPVHRTFHVALVEAVCDSFMTPRLDPERIESAGLVVRRVGRVGAEERSEKATGRLPAVFSRRRRELSGRAGESRELERRPRVREAYEGWMRSGRRVRGWVPFADEEMSGRAAALSADPKADPDPELRPAPLRSGNAGIDERLAQWLGLAEPLSESVSPLFVAPPKVCKAAGRTILYGVIPVASVETREPPATGATEGAFAQAAPYDLQELREKLPAHLPFYLQRQGRVGANSVVPLAEQWLTFNNAGDEALERFILTLRQLRHEFDAFGETTREGEALFAELNRMILLSFQDVPVPTPLGNIVSQRQLLPWKPFGDFLKEAANILLDLDGREQAARGESVPHLRMPPFWPDVSAEQETRIVNLVFAVLQKRLEALASSEGRFDDPRASYRVRAFVRVKRRDGCPPVICWSDYSEPFTIAPWYESGDVPPVQVQLPDASEEGFLSKVKPNVAFVVPESLQNLLNRNKPEDFLKGEGKPPSGEGIGLGWICGFNIPVITLCAFIVLNIFLQLLNIVFWWLLFIKICIPFPRRK